MKKALGLAAFFAVLVMGAQAAVTVKVILQAANVRERPELSAPVVAQVKKGDVFSAERVDAAWLSIQVRNASGQMVKGFIRAEMVEVSGETTAAVPPPGAAPAAVRPPAGGQRMAPAELFVAPRKGQFNIFAGLVLGSHPGGDFSTLTYTGSAGVALGLEYETPLSNTFFFSLGAQYSSTGYSRTDSWTTYDYSYSVFEAPIGIKIYLSPQRTAPFLFFGGVPGYIVSETVTIDGTEQYSSSGFCIPLVIGAGINIATGEKSSFQINARYTIFRDLLDEMYVNRFFITLGIGF